jgi:hypothetical protein
MFEQKKKLESSSCYRPIVFVVTVKYVFGKILIRIKQKQNFSSHADLGNPISRIWNPLSTLGKTKQNE